jgi:hypothetical protein
MSNSDADEEHVPSAGERRIRAATIGEPQRIDGAIELCSYDESWPRLVPPMEAAGYVLRIREPDWYEHRLFKGPDTNINLHVFSARCIEIERMLGFRDHLRGNASDRALYAATKRELAARHWRYVQEYADAKTEVVEAIIARAAATARS